MAPLDLSPKQQMTAIIWYMQGCIATFYDSKKKPVGTESLLLAANLAYRKINLLKIATPAIPYLSRLTKLELQNNYLSELPAELWRLEYLRELNVGRNQLTSIPPAIARLQHLRELYIYDNALTELPPVIGLLPALQVLDITHNRLTSLPSQILHQRRLHTHLDQNPFDAPESTCTWPCPLRSQCLQITGIAVADSEDDISALERSCVSPSIVDSLKHDHALAVPCSQCQSTLYHNDLTMVRCHAAYGRKALPIMYRACSQSCWNSLIKDEEALESPA
ncbi:hypothetical protein BCR43DRAFT_118860 [Syncephalastrum racemosum]|uniref:Uncharacterized protein n=1 Tax=Syncephalastrum racemosum TaxID=13706 RepID=A0A1X2GZG5_SYNRA|nr:hypothetical protein BCR43DRAFT_118860 [Syncephalastrum racemosum]